MTDQILILGGRGRIGSAVAQDLLNHTSASLVLTGKQTNPAWKNPLPSDRAQFLPLDLSDQDALDRAVAQANLVIHCAGPFHYRDEAVLRSCIKHRVNYLDVSDNVQFTRRLLALRDEAKQAGITAVLNTGIFPGISNSLVRLCIEQLDVPQDVHLSYVVSGSGGAGITVMRTTFLGLLAPFSAWINRQWQTVKPYTEREPVVFPPPFGRVYVYWYEVPETVMIPDTFPINSMVTKFGSVPDLYNHLTWVTAHVFPKFWLNNPKNIEFLAQVSYRMTQFSDRFSGIAVGMQCDVSGEKDGATATYRTSFVHENTAIAAGYGTGSIAQLVLAGQLLKPGVWTVEQALPTDLFLQTLNQRQIDVTVTAL